MGYLCVTTMAISESDKMEDWIGSQDRVILSEQKNENQEGRERKKRTEGGNIYLQTTQSLFAGFLQK